MTLEKYLQISLKKIYLALNKTYVILPYNPLSSLWSLDMEQLLVPMMLGFITFFVEPKPTKLERETFRNWTYNVALMRLHPIYIKFDPARESFDFVKYFVFYFILKPEGETYVLLLICVIGLWKFNFTALSIRSINSALSLKFSTQTRLWSPSTA